MFATIDLTSQPPSTVMYYSVELNACRACLTTETKLYSLHGPLAQPFEDITGTPVSKTDGLPQHICGVCCAQLQKCAAFRAKCRKAHYTLQDARFKSPMITTFFIRNLDTTSLKLHLTKTETLTLDYMPKTNLKLSEDVQDDNSDVQSPAEIEVIDDDDDVQSPAGSFPVVQHDEDVQFVSYDYNDLETYCVEMTDDEDNIGTVNDFIPDHPPIEEIKIEETIVGFNSFYNAESFLNSNEEEKNIKEKKQLENPSNNKKHNSLKDGDVKKIEQVEVKKKRRKMVRGKTRNLRNEEDFESFSKLYNFEAKLLTKEEQIKFWQERKKSERYQRARFKCELCFTGFIMESSFNNHMKCHDPSRGSLVCEVCQIRFPDDKLLRYRVHCNMHSKRFVCTLCNRRSKHSHAAKEHHRWHEGHKYECKDCGKFFAHYRLHWSHIRKHHKPHTCDLCQETLAGEKALAGHKKLKHAQKCESCNTIFDNAEALAHHRETAVELCTAHRSCFLCGENFPELAELNEHQRDQHQDKLLQCKECPLMFPSDEKRRTHWRNRHGGPANKEVICEVCAKSFWNLTTLRNHQRLHTNERPFHCSRCPKKFTAKYLLQVHMNIHTGERPYKCRMCPASFKSHATRYTHQLSKHSSERPHKCQLCDKTYAIVGDLKMHLRTFHMKLPYPPRRNPRRRTNKITE